MITRFAPSPTGLLHLGHAYSALLAYDRARAAGGTFLLRIEDTDVARCRPEFEAAIYEDLDWLGITWETPVMRQSKRLPAYAAAIDRLSDLGLTYPCSCSRADIRAALSAPQEGAQETSPDGVIYPGTCRNRKMSDRGPQDAIRLNLTAAIAYLGDVSHLAFTEIGPAHSGAHNLDSITLQTRIGDIVIARKDIDLASYHISVVVDDAAQGVTDVIRGEDLFEATMIHRFLQALLKLPSPTYYHHKLIRDNNGKRLAKRDDSRAIRKYRRDGVTPSDIRSMTGL